MPRLAIAQMCPRKGAYQENLCRLGELFRQAAGWAEPPDLMLAPEAALTGYFRILETLHPAIELFRDFFTLNYEI